MTDHASTFVHISIEEIQNFNTSRMNEMNEFERHAVGVQPSIVELLKRILETKSLDTESRLWHLESLKAKELLISRSLDKTQILSSLSISLVCDMMGENASDYAAIECILLTQAQTLSNQERKLLYLMASIWLQTSDPNLTLLIINSLARDLTSDDVWTLESALSCLSHIATQDMIESLFPKVEKLLSNASILVRKRALMAYFTFLNKWPNLLTQEGMIQLKLRISDSDPSVMGVCLVGIERLIEKDPTPFLFMGKPLVHILSQITNGKMPTSYTFQSESAPWIHSSILRILSKLNDHNLSDTMIPQNELALEPYVSRYHKFNTNAQRGFTFRHIQLIFS